MGNAKRGRKAERGGSAAAGDGGLKEMEGLGEATIVEGVCSRVTVVRMFVNLSGYLMMMELKHVVVFLF
ncbi:hypothetical protein Hanom_Chr09g00833401 [Helianthus anomalus]